MKWFHMDSADATQAQDATWARHGAMPIQRVATGRDAYVRPLTEADAAKYRAECDRLGVPYEETDQRLREDWDGAAGL